MTHLELVKKLGLTDIVLCLLDEFGYSDEEISNKMQVTIPTIYNAKKRLEPVSEALKTIVGELPKEYGNPDVNRIIDAYKQSFGTVTASKYDRFAAKQLSDKYGADNIVKIIQVLAQHSGDKYTPVIGSVRQLRDKWVNVSAFFKKLKSEEIIEL